MSPSIVLVHGGFVDGAINALVWRGLTRVVPTRLMVAVSGRLVEG